MKKYLYVILILFLSFLFGSFSLVLIYPFKNAKPSTMIDEVASQRLYAIIDAVDNYNASYEESAAPVIDRLADILALHIIVDYNAAEIQLSDASENLTIKAYYIDFNRISLANDLTFDFSAYNNYIYDLSKNAMEQLYGFILNENLYTLEREIRVTFKDTDDYLDQIAVLNNDDLKVVQYECFEAAKKIYEDYINESEMSTAFLLDSIKTLSLENIVEVYNKNNSDNPIEDEWQKELFADYAQNYIDNMIIENLLNSAISPTTLKCSITYQIEHGNSTIDSTFKMLLDSYYLNKQPPVDELQIIHDFGEQLNLYRYNDTTALYSKSFDFTFSRNLNEFQINDDFYVKIANDIYEEFIKFTDIFDIYYPQIENQYFFIERPYTETIIITDNTDGSRYRQLDINVTGPTDCYVKLFSYNTVTDTYNELVLVTYIKSGDSLQVFIPEGDYILKYATGILWYGDVHMFSDSGQYFSGTNVISVHEYMMTTTIELGNFDSGSMPAYSQTPDQF